VKRDQIQDRLPEWVAGRLDPEDARRVRDAVEADVELQAEADLLRSLRRTRPEVPPGLEDRILSAVTGSRSTGVSGGGTDHRWEIPRWVMAAAAALVVALGTLDVATRRSDPGLDPYAVALEAPPGTWQDDDGVVAGAPVLDGLSDQALDDLLREMGG
jgi:hypothetical protein